MSNQSLIEHCSADDALAKFVLELLHKHYPGHTWIVQATHSQGQITIQNPSLSYKMGMRMFIPKLSDYNSLVKAVVKYGGEFLERHRISREKKADRDQIQELFKTGRFQ
jgi:hypothetical protein